MSKYDITYLYSKTPCHIMSSGEYTQDFYVGKEVTKNYSSMGDTLLTITAIQDNYKRLGYYSVILSDKSGNPVEFVNVFNPSSVSCKVADAKKQPEK